MTNPAPKKVSNGTRLGEYDVVGILGAGGMGTVYKGVHPIIGKEVAIKVLAPHLSQNESMVQRFIQEARAVVKIQHINIIDVFAFGHQESVGHYFIMPLLAGEALGDRISRAGALSLKDALPILEQIVAALDTAHEAGIYHRDLKPDNVYLATQRTGPPSVRVLDFGIAKLVESEVSATQTGVQMGTPLFMSPEQWEGRGVDHRTDIYALAVLAHNIITGRYPYETSSHIALMNMHVNGEPKLPSVFGAPAALDKVFAKALAKDKEYRYQSATEFFQAFEGAAQGSDVTTSVASPPAVAALGTMDTEYHTETPVPQRRSSVLFLALGGAAAVVVVGALLLRGGDDTVPASSSMPEPAEVEDERPGAGNEPAAVPAAKAPLALPPASDAGAPANSVDAGAISGSTSPVDAGETKPARTRRRDRDSRTRRRDSETTPPKNEPKPGEKTQWGNTVDPY